MNNNQQVGQKDIAKALGVSVNTVSHALRDLNDISIELKEKIKQKAKELGYVPNGTAIKLKTGSSKTIALVYDSLINPFFSFMASKISYLIKQQGYDTIIVPSNKSNLITFNTFMDLLELQVDGILSFLDFDESVINSKLINSLPIVIIGRHSSTNIPTINIDDFMGGKLVGEYFKTKEYKKILFTCPQEAEMTTKRYEGLLSIFNEKDVIKLYYKEEEENISYILDIIKLENIKAVFGFNDMISVILENAIREENLDTEVVGFDYLHGVLSYINELTSVKFDFDEFAKLSVQSLFKLINNETVNNIKLPVELHIKGDSNYEKM